MYCNTKFYVIQKILKLVSFVELGLLELFYRRASKIKEEIYNFYTNNF